MFTLWLPIFTIRVIPRMKIMGKKFIDRYWALYGDYKPKGKRFLFYPWLLVIRKLIFAIFIVALKDKPLIQTILLILLFIPYLLYMIIIRPYRWVYVNLMMILNEFTILAVTCLFLIFHTANQKAWTRYIGWGIMIAIFLNVILNLIIIWI